MRDEEAIRRSRAAAFDHVTAEQWVSVITPAEVAAARAEYVDHGWRPSGPKELWSRETAKAMARS